MLMGREDEPVASVAAGDLTLCTGSQPTNSGAS